MSCEHNLTSHEGEIALYLGRGRNYAYTAGALTVSENAMHALVRNIYHKLGIFSREKPRLSRPVFFSLARPAERNPQVNGATIDTQSSGRPSFGRESRHLVHRDLPTPAFGRESRYLVHGSQREARRRSRDAAGDSAPHTHGRAQHAAQTKPAEASSYPRASPYVRF